MQIKMMYFQFLQKCRLVKFVISSSKLQKMEYIFQLEVKEHLEALLCIGQLSI